MSSSSDNTFEELFDEISCSSLTQDELETAIDTDDDDGNIPFLINSVLTSVIAYATPLYLKQPYHTSILTGLSWVQELINGHPKCIRRELGVHLHIFDHLLSVLQKMGYSDLRHVQLEEQLTIFLYMCVTGLSMTHVGERFQCSDDTLSKFVC
jgi:hypothetical protein